MKDTSIYTNLIAFLENEIDETKTNIKRNYAWYDNAQVLRDRNRAYGSVLFALTLITDTKIKNDIISLWENDYFERYQKLMK